jgi:hypothetical protein
VIDILFRLYETGDILAGGFRAITPMSGCLVRAFTATARKSTAIARKPTATARKATAKIRKPTVIARESTATAVGLKTFKIPFFSGF